jgi:hypothetical protein
VSAFAIYFYLTSPHMTQKVEKRREEKVDVLLLLRIRPQVPQELLILLSIAAQLGVKRTLGHEVRLQRCVAFLKRGKDSGEGGVESGKGGTVLFVANAISDDPLHSRGE